MAMAKAVFAPSQAAIEQRDRANACREARPLPDTTDAPADFAEIYSSYGPSIYRYCRLRMSTHEAAEDATSRVFTKALTALPRYRAGSFRSWLFSIAHNEVIDAGRACKPESSIDAETRLATRVAGPEESAIAAEAADELRALLQLLNPSQRTVLELRLAGVPTDEIATITGKSVVAIRTEQSRAIARLRDHLALQRTGDPDRTQS